MATIREAEQAARLAKNAENDAAQEEWVGEKDPDGKLLRATETELDDAIAAKESELSAKEAEVAAKTAEVEALDIELAEKEAQL